LFYFCITNLPYLHKIFLESVEMKSCLWKTDTFENRNLLRKVLVWNTFQYSKLFIFLKVPDMGKSLLLESDEKEKRIIIKPFYTLSQDIQEKWKNEKSFMR